MRSALRTVLIRWAITRAVQAFVTSGHRGLPESEQRSGHQRLSTVMDENAVVTQQRSAMLRCFVRRIDLRPVRPPKSHSHLVSW